MTTGSVIAVASASESPPPDSSAPGRFTDRTRRLIETAIFAVLVYVPILLMAPGRVESDTKSYLYLDPARLLARASTIWTPSVGLGGLSHQTSGYLFPMGPFYWILEEVLGVPAWVAQRLWLATIIFVAGLGVRYLLRTLGVRGYGIPVAMLVYAFSPYVLGNSPQYSPLLLPWAALPWWIAFMALGLRRGGWKYPALFAIGVQLTAALNGSAFIYAIIGPALWLLYSLFVIHESTLRSTWKVVWRTATLTLLSSLWWVVSLGTESQYGLNILRFTESIQVVSVASLPAEILRGLGNWYFYGGDRNGLWSDARPFYTQRFWLIFISLLVPALALLAAGLVRWTYKSFFVVLVLVGMVISVGPSPYEDPSILGGIYKEFALNSAFGFSLRNTVRAVPLLALGLAVLLGAGVSSLFESLRGKRWRPYAYVAAAFVGVLCLVNAVPALTGHYYNKALQRDEEIPQYYQDAVKHLDAISHDTRVFALPGAPFATYRWGDLKDPLEPGLMDRPFVDRELVPAGSEQAANLVQSLDHRLQEHSLETDSVAPIARLMGVGDIELRMDLQTDQYALITAGELWKTFTDPVPEGLGKPVTFGTKIPGRLEFPDPGDLTRPGPKPKDPPPVAVLPVKDPLSVIRAKAQTSPLVVAGDGEGLVDMAAAGLLDPKRLVLYSAPYEHDAAKLRRLTPGAALVLTDSNRKRGTRWSGMKDNYSYTEQAGEEALQFDPLDQRLEPFPESTDATRTVTLLSGVKSVRATTYGSPSYNYSPDTRPAMAMDGDLDTAWLADPATVVGKERLLVELDHPITTDHVNLVQLARILGPAAPRDPRYITKVGLRFDDGDQIQRSLTRRSRTEQGQDVRFPKRTFSTFELEIDGVYRNERNGPVQMNAVGINELRLTDDASGATPVRAGESQKLPTDLLTSLGKQSADHPLALVLSRESTMDGSGISRTFDLPTARSFVLGGSVTLGPKAKDPVLDRALGVSDATTGGITTTSKHSALDPIARSSSAVDGDLETAWVGQIREVVPSMKVELAEPTTIDHLDLQIVADGRHSMPTEVTITGDDGTKRVIALPVDSVAPRPGNIIAAPITFEPMTTTSINLSVDRALVVKRQGDGRPVAIAEIGIPGVVRPARAALLPGTCTDDLIEIDGKPFPVRVTGTTDDAVRLQPLALETCDPAGAVALGAGEHTISGRMSPFNPTGFDIRRILLTSGAGGGPISAAEFAEEAPEQPATKQPRVRILKEDATSMSLRVDDASAPFWLVLGQSYNKGWVAKADGKTLAEPELVDGYANGWQVRPNGNGPMTITLEWTPQKSFEIAAVLSLVATLLCLGIVIGAFVRVRRRRRAAATAAAAMPDAPEVAVRPEPVDALGVGASFPPRLLGSWLTRPLARRPWATVLTVAATGIAASLLIRPWVGLLVGALVLLAILSPRGRLVLRFLPPLIVVGVAVYMTVGQRLDRFPPSFDWAQHFDAASVPTWIAVALLAADALISMVWRTDREDQADEMVADEAVSEPV